MTADLHLFDALAWRMAQPQPGLRQGAHRGRMRGAGGAFADLAPLLAYPDARRLDLRRSLTDPMGGFFVRRFERPADITLHVLVDASASLGAGALSDRQGLAALMAGGLAQAARRGGDRAAVQAVGGNEILAALPPSRRAGIGQQARDLIAALIPTGSGVGGLIAAASSLPRRRVLVAVISDFDISAPELALLLEALSPRPVLPIWLRDSGLEEPPGDFGLAEIRDPETGRRRTLLTSGRWAARQAQASLRHRQSLRAVFAGQGLRPVEIRDSIDIGDLIATLDEAPL
ncbi:hypothetical protein PARHAE_01374 [Paracoccus haematequi]|uniref:DUF58 domain-containing protein n=1 Tax=Paracoccus haematequi TaxID=2491866 RepID=A0A3S4CY11_9RHOB|nr:hypothetical protein [Paracoccus haematequi]VDS08191.1 hypothetical protein PARHAE_01374 [Paracoccus haematequi]